MPLNPSEMRDELENRVLARTGGRVRYLDIECQPESVVLRGLAGSYYVKQLAQEGVREFLPHVRLENAIRVA